MCSRHVRYVTDHVAGLNDTGPCMARNVRSGERLKRRHREHGHRMPSFDINCVGKEQRALAQVFIEVRIDGVQSGQVQRLSTPKFVFRAQ